jgi:hypothetical protein
VTEPEITIGELIEEPRRTRNDGKWVNLAQTIPVGEWHVLNGLTDQMALSARSSFQRRGVTLRKLRDNHYAVYRKPPTEDGSTA